MSIRYVYEKWNSVTQSKYEGFSESLVTTFTGTYTTDIPVHAVYIMRQVHFR